MLVSVLMLAYNHEQFIAQALESALAQQTDFDVEIVVGEDCSTDSTRRILLDYQQRFPHKIRLLLPTQNQGMLPNFLQTYAACQGEYLAILEGDDYWTATDKLQKQVDFLRNNPQLSGVFHDVTIESNNADRRATTFFPSPLEKTSYDQEDFAGGNFIPTCSLVVRKVSERLPDWFLRIPMGDWPLHLYTTHWGSYGYLDENLAVYRVHENGNWSNATRVETLKRSIIATLKIMQVFRTKPMRKRFNRVIRDCESEILRALAPNGSVPSTARHIFSLYLVRTFCPVRCYKMCKSMLRDSLCK